MATLTRELAYPLSIDSGGGFAVYTSPDQAAAAHLRLIIGTELGERLMIPDYGTQTMEHLFDEINEDRVNELKRDVADALATWADNNITIQNIEVTAVQNQVDVAVIYSLSQTPNANQSVSVSVSVQG